MNLNGPLTRHISTCYHPALSLVSRSDVILADEDDGGIPGALAQIMSQRTCFALHTMSVGIAVLADGDGFVSFGVGVLLPWVP